MDCHINWIYVKRVASNRAFKCFSFQNANIQIGPILVKVTVNNVTQNKKIINDHHRKQRLSQIIMLFIIKRIKKECKSKIK